MKFQKNIIFVLPVVWLTCIFISVSDFFPDYSNIISRLNKQIQFIQEEIKDYNAKQVIPLNDSRYWAWRPMQTWENHFQKVYDSRLKHLDPPANILECDAKFETNLLQNLKKISGYKFNVSETMQRFLKLDSNGLKELSEYVPIKMRPIIFVTAASENHFRETEALLFSMKTKFVDRNITIRLIYYDIGLQPQHRTLLEKLCSFCEVRSYPKANVSAHTAIAKAYTWKPIVIHLALMDFPLITWIDASIRFQKKNFDDHLKDAILSGIQFIHGDGKINFRTMKQTFDFLNEAPCLYGKPESPAGFITIHRNPFTVNYIMKPWVFCALTFNCMYFDNCEKYISGCNHTLHSCHRFEQSVVGILLSRTFRETRDIVFMNESYVNVARGHTSTYLENLEKTNKNQTIKPRA